MSIILRKRSFCFTHLVLSSALLLFVVLLFTALILAACQTSELIPTIQPTSRVWQVQFTPTMHWIGPILNQCTREQANTNLVLQERSATSPDLSGLDFTFRWGKPETVNGYAAILGWDNLVIIVHPNNPLKSISLPDLRTIYSGGLQKWSDLTSHPTLSGEIQAWTYPTGEDAQQVFTSILEIKKTTLTLYLASDPEVMRQAIAANPTALGYLPQRWLDASVKALPVNDAAPDIFRQPILVLTTTEPQGAQKEWLLCLQDALLK